MFLQVVRQDGGIETRALLHGRPLSRIS